MAQMDEVNDSVIFTDVDDPIASRYAKCITTSRVLIFIFAGLTVGFGVLGFLAGIYMGFNSDTWIVIDWFGSIGLVYLVLGLTSVKRPYVSLVITSILNSLLFLFAFIGIFGATGNEEYIYVGAFLLLQLLFTIFTIRGLYYVEKIRKHLAKSE